MATAHGRQRQVGYPTAVGLGHVSSDSILLQSYRQLIERTNQVFGDPVTASRWLSMPSADLDGEVPLQVAQREGYALTSLEPIFTRIEHGIYV